MIRKQIGWLTAVLILIITACTTAEAPVQETTATALPEPEAVDIVSTNPPAPTVEIMEGVVLPDLGNAPEITNDVWINADAPVTLASQKGKVVLIEFWTFG